MPPGVSMSAWAAVIVCAVVAIACVTDVRKGIVPNWLTYPAIVAGLVGHALTGGLAGSPTELGLAGSAIGLVTGFGPLLLCWMLLGGISGGDAKLMGAIGALGGWEFVIRAAILGFVVVALMAIGLMIYKGLVRQTLRRLWVTLVLLFTGAKPSMESSPDSPKVPVAVGLCIGTLAVLAETYWRTGVLDRLFG